MSFTNILLSSDTLYIHHTKYLHYLSENNKSAAIRRRINSLGAVLKPPKNLDPTKQPEVILTLKRMHRKIGRAQEQAKPLPKHCSLNYLKTAIQSQEFKKSSPSKTRLRNNATHVGALRV